MPTRFRLNSIGAQVALAVGAMLLGLLCVIGVGVVGLSNVERNITGLVQVEAVKTEAAAQMRLAIVSRVDTVRNIALSTEVNAMQGDLKRLDELVAQYADQRKALLASGLSPAEQAALDKSDAADAKAAPFLKQAVALARSMQPELAAEMLTAKLGPVQRQWMAALDELSAATAAGHAAVLASAQAARQRTLVWMCSVGLLAAVAGSALAWLVVRGISARLHQAMALTRRIADGDLSTRVDHHGSDEVAQTLDALTTMQTRLHGTIGEVRAAVLAIETAAAEIASGSNDLSARTEQSASSLQQTASSMEELTGTVKSAAASATVASDLARSASAVAESGGTVVARVVSTMEEINTSSRRIGEIIGVIDGIAFQTNILALNAAVEAARAGEHGRGFAVVASEVRSLAQRSAEAAREIKGLIGASVDRVDAGSRLVGQAGNTMTDIVASVRRVSDVITEISLAAGEQTQGLGQINGAVADLDSMTQQNAALVEQSAAAAMSMREQTSRLARAVEAFRLQPAG